MEPTSPRVEGTRRTVGARVRGRSARVRESVLAAATAEFARYGYEGFRVEAVATAAGVNKTSIYRRWPTKLALVDAILRAARPLRDDIPDTGTIRGDFEQLVRNLLAHYDTPYFAGVIAMLATTRDDVAVRDLIRDLKRESYARYATIIRQAEARGEIPAGSDATIIVDAILAPISQRVIRMRERVEPAYVTSLIELVVRGAAAGGAVG